MNKLYFATTNPEKLLIAQTVCAPLGVDVVQANLEIDEIQGEDPDVIVRDKAQRAFKLLGRPIVVSDDSWNIPALNGFPGPYMKSINQWFKAEDFINLMKNKQNRKIILHQYLAYADGKKIKIVKNDIHGIIIKSPRGKSEKSPNMTVIELDSDNGKTIAEVFEQGAEAVAARYKDRPDAWHEFVEWYKTI